MPRRQQKAVFAKMGDGSSLRGIESFAGRRKSLIKRKAIEETTEDRIFEVMQNKRLTHRQKLARIAEIKKAAAKKLDKTEETVYSGSGIAPSKRRFDNKKSIFFKAESRELAEAISIESPTEFKKSIKRVKALKGIPAVTKKRALILAQNRAKAQLKRKKLSRKERKEFEAIAEIKIAQMAKLEFKKSDKNLSWKQVKAKYKGISPSADLDKDGVKNVDDCRPLDRNRQHAKKKKKKSLLSAVGEAIGKAAEKEARARFTREGQIERLKAKAKEREKVRKEKEELKKLQREERISKAKAAGVKLPQQYK